jgi:hypothetical protein
MYQCLHPNWIKWMLRHVHRWTSWDVVTIVGVEEVAAPPEAQRCNGKVEAQPLKTPTK